MRFSVFTATIIGSLLISSGTAITYKNVGRTPYGETLVMNSMSAVRNPFVKNGLIVETSEGSTATYLLNVLRPFYKIPEQAFVGYIEGFLNADIKNPVYCLTDGIDSLSASISILNSIFNEPNPWSSDLWMRYSDSAYLLNQKCNLANSAATTMTALFF